MTTLLEGNHPVEWLLSDEEQQSVDVGTLASGQNLKSGAVLGQITKNTTATSTAVVGTGVVTRTVGALGVNAIVGTYTLTCITAGATAVYEVELPTGEQLATNAVVGSGAINIDDHFTLTLVNVTNSAVGDVFTVVVAAATTGTITNTAIVGTGNGAITLGAIGGLAKSGVYSLRVTEAATNAGTFSVYAPLTGEFIADVTVGGGATSVANYFTITIADGSTDFVVGDNFTVTIQLPVPKWTQHDASAINGSQVAAGILYNDVDASSSDLAATIFTRMGEVFDGKLTWKTNITAAQKAQAVADLSTKFIIVRA